MKRLLAAWLSLLLIFIAGCGSSNNDDIITGQRGNGAADASTGTLVFNFIQAQTAVPQGTAELVFEFFNNAGQSVLTETRAFNTRIQINNVPASAVRVRFTCLDQNGFVLARAEEPVVVIPGESQTVTLDVVAVTFDSLSVSPNPIVLTTGDSATLTIRGEFSDDSSIALANTAVTLQSNNTAVATVSPAGVVTGESAGQTTLLATFTIPGTDTQVVSEPVSVTVTDATLEGFTIAPNPVTVKAGGTVQLTVTGVFSNDAQTVLDPSTVTFNESSPEISIDGDGLLSGLSEGSATFTVSSDDVTSDVVNVTVTEPSLDAVNVTPDPIALTTAGTVQLSLQGDFSDGVQRPLAADQASYSGNNTSIATVDGNGLVSPVAPGNTVVSVGFVDPVSGNTISSGPIDISVMNAVTLDSLSVAPDPVSLRVGDDVQLSVTANFSDMTTQPVDASTATYDVINSAVATIDADGLLTGASEGMTTFTVTYDMPGGSGPVTSDPINVEVTPATLDAVVVTPDPICLGTGSTVQIESEGLFSDGSSQMLAPGDGTYSGHDTGVVTISATGLVTPVAIGSTTVTVSFEDPATMATVSSSAVTIEVVGPALSLSGVNSFDTDTGQLNGIVPGGWDGSILKVESFELQGGATLNVTGTAPFQVETCGDTTIAGTINAAGGDGGDGNTGSPISTRGVAGVAGPGGFQGGLGGGIDGTSPNRNGEAGAGPGAGGGGETLGLVFVPPSGFAGENENGGGGGGHATTGAAGILLGTTGTPGAGGATYASIPTQLRGGSGGGGGSSFIDTAGNSYSGGGGGGGGGAVSFIAQGSLTVSGSIDCSGGVGGDKGPAPAGAGAGGGAGGAIQLLASSTPTVSGTLNVSGGGGGSPGGGAGGSGRTLVSAIVE